MAVGTVPQALGAPPASAAAIKSGISRRYAAERRFRLYGIAAILFGLV